MNKELSNKLFRLEPVQYGDIPNFDNQRKRSSDVLFEECMDYGDKDEYKHRQNIMDKFFDDEHIDRQVSSRSSNWTKNNTEIPTGTTPSRNNNNSTVNWLEKEKFSIDIYYLFVHDVYQKYLSHFECCPDCKEKGIEKPRKRKDTFTA
ncbi:hypothetical protein JR316_0005131 [Psilocybe cubensis]|uniref:Uncharacterized protein n=1 Tax=Psilocybe cubensis TaxID=181762 RepID=A0ACB8H588_PSICU|nr:hypothetical protein JR316_0005131 [Psilocybe cubensis]KAH9483031.1 hypothetical protein JR316_0005131 [Psilocybe cubensis]